MKLRIVLFVLSVAAIAAFGLFTQAHAYYQNWNSYWAARGFGPDLGTVLREQRNTEAVINEMRAARGAPPCSIGLIGQLAGKPRCP